MHGVKWFTLVRSYKILNVNFAITSYNQNFAILSAENTVKMLSLGQQQKKRQLGPLGRESWCLPYAGFFKPQLCAASFEQSNFFKCIPIRHFLL